MLKLLIAELLPDKPATNLITNWLRNHLQWLLSAVELDYPTAYSHVTLLHDQFYLYPNLSKMIGAHPVLGCHQSWQLNSYDVTVWSVTTNYECRFVHMYKLSDSAWVKLCHRLIVYNKAIKLICCRIHMKTFTEPCIDKCTSISMGYVCCNYNFMLSGSERSHICCQYICSYTSKEGFVVITCSCNEDWWAAIQVPIPIAAIWYFPWPDLIFSICSLPLKSTVTVATTGTWDS